MKRLSILLRLVPLHDPSYPRLRNARANPPRGRLRRPRDRVGEFGPDFGPPSRHRCWNEQVPFDLDRALLRIDDRDDVAALDRIAGVPDPLDQRAGLHVGAERGHPEFSHGGSRADARLR